VEDDILAGRVERERVDVARVADDELHAARGRRACEELSTPHREIVDHRDRAARHQALDEVTPDEAGAADDERPHAGPRSRSSRAANWTSLRKTALSGAAWTSSGHTSSRTRAPVRANSSSHSRGREVAAEHIDPIRPIAREIHQRQEPARPDPELEVVLQDHRPPTHPERLFEQPLGGARVVQDVGEQHDVEGGVREGERLSVEGRDLERGPGLHLDVDPRGSGREALGHREP
jgi:hypothetical protein